MNGPLNEAGERWDDDYGLDPRAETTTPQLTEAQIADIEERLKVVYAKWHDPGFTKRLLDRDIPALIRDWRAMEAENERLNRLIAEATVTAPWRAGYTDYVPTAGDPVRSITDLIAHIKERGGQVNQLESSVTFWQAEALLNHFCSEHAKNTRQIGHYCTVCAKPFVMSVPQGERSPKYKDLIAENAALREQLAQAESEIARTKQHRDDLIEELEQERK